MTDAERAAAKPTPATCACGRTAAAEGRLHRLSKYRGVAPLRAVLRLVGRSGLEVRGGRAHFRPPFEGDRRPLRGQALNHTDVSAVESAIESDGKAPASSGCCSLVSSSEN